MTTRKNVRATQSHNTRSAMAELHGHTNLIEDLRISHTHY